MNSVKDNHMPLVLSAASLLLTWGFLRTTLRVRTALRQLENWVREDAV